MVGNSVLCQDWKDVRNHCEEAEGITLSVRVTKVEGRYHAAIDMPIDSSIPALNFHRRAGQRRLVCGQTEQRLEVRGLGDFADQSIQPLFLLARPPEVFGRPLIDIENVAIGGEYRKMRIVTSLPGRLSRDWPWVRSASSITRLGSTPIGDRSRGDVPR